MKGKDFFSKVEAHNFTFELELSQSHQNHDKGVTQKGISKLGFKKPKPL